jgi:integrase
VAQAVLPGDGDLTRLTAHTVTRRILDLSHRYSVAFTKYWVSAVRVLLRYLFAHGKIATDLIGAIPAVAGWRLTGIPQDLDPAVVAQIVRACDGRTHEGCRTRAAVLLMVRLGLRVGKSQRCDLTMWTGARARSSFAARDAGPIVCRCRSTWAPPSPRMCDEPPADRDPVLFLRVCAPHRPTGSGALKSAVRAACRRAGVPEIGTHRLRHTAASQMLRRGSSLSEIAQVLRHRHLDTTAIYAKVDRVALREVARPWPGGAGDLLRDLVAEYLALRRALGYAAREGWLLHAS